VHSPHQLSDGHLLHVLNQVSMSDRVQHERVLSFSVKYLAADATSLIATCSSEDDPPQMLAVVHPKYWQHATAVFDTTIQATQNRHAELTEGLNHIARTGDTLDSME
jgi:hypothetical protein